MNDNDLHNIRIILERVEERIKSIDENLIKVVEHSQSLDRNTEALISLAQRIETLPIPNEMKSVKPKQRR